MLQYIKKLRGDRMIYKRWTRWGLALLIILFGALNSKAAAEAVQPDYSITAYRSHITLHPDGSVTFDEAITYQLLQESAEITKSIPMAYSSKVEGMEVFRREPAESEDPEAEPELKALEQSSHTSSGETYTYEPANEEEDIYHIIIPVTGSKWNEVTFVYRYRMMDTIFLYKDTAAFFWRFIQPDPAIGAQDVQIDVSMQDALPTDEWKGYVRGTVYAHKEWLEDGVFRISAERVRPGEFLESVLLLPNALFPEGRKIIDNLAEDEIVSDMALWEEEASRTRQEEELKFYGGWAFALLSFMLCLGTGLLLYLKTRTRKRGPAAVSARTEKVMPDASISPAELGLLLNNGKIGMRELLATVLFLIQRRYLELHYNDNEGGYLTLREDISRDGLKPHEAYVLQWLTAEQGKENRLSLNTLEQILTGHGGGFRHKTATWKSLVHKRTGRSEHLENIAKMKAWAMGAVFISVLAALLAGFSMGNKWAAVSAGICAAVLAVYVIPLKKISESGKLFKAQWSNYKEELLAQLDDEQNPMPLQAWEEKLVYALPLGIAGKLFNKLIMTYKETAFEDGNLTILYRRNHQWLFRVLEKAKK